MYRLYDASSNSLVIPDSFGDNEYLSECAESDVYLLSSFYWTNLVTLNLLTVAGDVCSRRSRFIA